MRWAVANGARVINMSLSGLRDPANPSRDTYSQLEADAVAYAVSKGVLVVAAVGNSDQSPSQPWPYASWPAALPHVIGVSALSRRGGIPAFSNRDPAVQRHRRPGRGHLLDIAARSSPRRAPTCADQGYSSCGPDEYRDAEGTSFATPQVTAAGGMLIATSPGLAPDQVLTLLEQSAVDATTRQRLLRVHGRPRPLHRLRGASTRRRRSSSSLPVRRRAIASSRTTARASRPIRSGVPAVEVDATLDYWNDRDDVYRVHLRAGERLVAVAPAATATAPDAVALAAGDGRRSARRAACRESLVHRPAGSAPAVPRPSGGLVPPRRRLAAPARGAYRLSVTKTR